MNLLNFLAITLLYFGNHDTKQTNAQAKEITVIEQDYQKALNLAAQEEKLVFIDFYTVWCGPCKKLDKLVFQNDSIRKILAKNFVILRYDAENDTVFHLSKKHHVSSYPTGLILNKDGYVLNRQYGFRGNDAQSLQKNVLAFAEESIALNKENKILKGYSNEINASSYPKFYVDYVNRTNTKINQSEVSSYFINTDDVFSEEYFAALIYFGREVPVNIADRILENKQKYISLYGQKDVETLLFFLVSARFSLANSEKDKDKYDEAVSFAKNALSEKWTNDILPQFEKDFLIAQNKWDKVFEINKKAKDKGELDSGYINYFSWQVYKKCEDQQVIANCITWMKDLTKKEPTYAYLDTYAHLLYKSGNKKEAKKIILLAIEAAKQENISTKALEELHKKCE